jgi:hypothetical protein
MLSGMLCRMALVRTDISEERITSFITVTRIGELGMLAVTSNRSMLQKVLHDTMSQYSFAACFGC